jgi:hypothetical protein
MPGRADDVTEVDVDLRREELDAPAPVDEVEERDLSHLPARHHAPGQPEELAVVLGARLDLVGDAPDRSDLVPVGKALRQVHFHRDDSSAGLGARRRRRAAALPSAFLACA